MSSKTLQTENIMSCSSLPVVQLKSLKIRIFIMRYHVYKSIWTPSKDEQLHAAMQPTKRISKYAVTVKRKEFEVVGHLPLRKSGKFTKIVFYFLKSYKNNDCIAVVRRKPVKQSEGNFTAEEKFIKILKDQLETLL